MSTSLLRREIRALRESLRKAHRALDFYADYATYMLPSEDFRGGARSGDAIYIRPILEDGGARARRALGEEAEDG